jgi:hypothetical protein
MRSQCVTSAPLVQRLAAFDVNGCQPFHLHGKYRPGENFCYKRYCLQDVCTCPANGQVFRLRLMGLVLHDLESEMMLLDVSN